MFPEKPFSVYRVLKNSLNQAFLKSCGNPEKSKKKSAEGQHPSGCPFADSVHTPVPSIFQFFRKKGNSLPRKDQSFPSFQPDAAALHKDPPGRPDQGKLRTAQAVGLIDITAIPAANMDDAVKPVCTGKTEDLFLIHDSTFFHLRDWPGSGIIFSFSGSGKCG